MQQVSEKASTIRVIGFAELKALAGTSWIGQGIDMEWAGTGNVVVSLDGVESLDQDGLASLLRFLRRVRAGGGEVALASLSRRVRLQAQKMRMHQIFDIFNTPEEALRRYTA